MKKPDRILIFLIFLLFLFVLGLIGAYSYTSILTGLLNGDKLGSILIYTMTTILYSTSVYSIFIEFEKTVLTRLIYYSLIWSYIVLLITIVESIIFNIPESFFDERFIYFYDKISFNLNNFAGVTCVMVTFLVNMQVLRIFAILDDRITESRIKISERAFFLIYGVRMAVEVVILVGWFASTDFIMVMPPSLIIDWSIRKCNLCSNNNHR